MALMPFKQAEVYHQAMKKATAKSAPAFDYSLDYSQLDFRAQPEAYVIGKGEQGVLLVEPYKSEILPHWRFKTPEIAEKSATQIYAQFEAYLAEGDFVGADMARKFLQMGYTRARRYANYKGGRKYAQNPQKAASEAEASQRRQKVCARQEDPVKAASAALLNGAGTRPKHTLTTWP